MKTVLLVLLCVLFAPFLAPYDPARSVGLPWQSPDALFWCGTDGLGRDVLSRTLHGGVAMLLFSLMATFAGSMVGLVTGLGLLVLPDRGYSLTALLDSILMLPPLLIVMMTYYALGPSPLTLLFAIILLNAPFTARWLSQCWTVITSWWPVLLAILPVYCFDVKSCRGYTRRCWVMGQHGWWARFICFPLPVFLASMQSGRGMTGPVWSERAWKEWRSIPVPCPCLPSASPAL
nr:hypothetical protein [Candidatus Symbiopectobacterium sp. 'North America']